MDTWQRVTRVAADGLDRHVGAVAGLITKEHLADSVSASIGPYASGEVSAL